MKFHPVCNLFPDMNAEEFARLKQSIKKAGKVRDAVVTLKGFIVDGKHRWRAAKELGITCPTKEWDGEGSLVEFVMDRNFSRRHLSPSQRAAVAREMLPLLEQESAARMKAGKKADPSANLREGLTPYKGKAAEQAAAAVGVSPRLVEQTKSLPKAAVAKVKAGEMTVNEARQAYKPKPRTTDAMQDRYGRKIPTPQIADALAAATDFTKLMQSCSTLKGAIRQLAETKPGAHINAQQIDADLSNVYRQIKFASPHCVCVYCNGAGCKACNSNGWISEAIYNNAPNDMKAAA